MFIDFQDKYVVVTGATSGIGEAISVELKGQGARPVLVGRNHDKMREMADHLEISEDCLMCLDLNNHAEIVSKIRELSGKIGRIYGFCHSAGVVETRPLSSISADKLKKMLNVNLIAGLEMSRAICRRDVMDESGGAVLFISSIYGLVGMAGEISYSASKGAVISAARAMAVELARRKIRVNTLSPGFVKTKMTDTAMAILSEQNRRELQDAHPLGTGTPEDVARAAIFLLAPQNSWITGTNMVVDGGFTAR